MDHEWKCKTWNCKAFREKKWENLEDLELNKEFSDLTPPEMQSTKGKIDRLDLTKILKFSAAKTLLWG